MLTTGTGRVRAPIELERIGYTNGVFALVGEVTRRASTGDRGGAEVKPANGGLNCVAGADTDSKLNAAGDLALALCLGSNGLGSKKALAAVPAVVAEVGGPVDLGSVEAHLSGGGGAKRPSGEADSSVLASSMAPAWA